MKAIVAGVALFAAIATVGLSAQEPAPQAPMRMRMHMPDSAHGMQGVPGAMMRGRMGQGMGPYMPGMLIRFEDFLDLTDDQVTQLEHLQQGLQEAHQAAQETIQEHQTALREAWQASQPDVNAIRQHMQAINQAQGQAQLAAATAAAQAKGMLSAEQQGKMQGWMDGRRAGARMRGMQQPRRPGMMRQRPGGRMPGRGW